MFFLAKCGNINDLILYEPVDDELIFIQDTLRVFPEENSTDETKDDNSVENGLS